MNYFVSLQNLTNTIMLNISMDQLKEMLPLLIPVIILEWALAIAALIHVLRHQNYKFGNKVVWIVVVLLIQLIGPIVYFAFGKGEE